MVGFVGCLSLSDCVKTNKWKAENYHLLRKLPFTTLEHRLESLNVDLLPLHLPVRQINEYLLHGIGRV